MPTALEPSAVPLALVLYSVGLVIRVSGGEWLSTNCLLCAGSGFVVLVPSLWECRKLLALEKPKMPTKPTKKAESAKK